jgi:hypothetical protein
MIVSHLRTKETIVIASVCVLFIVNAGVVLYLRFFNPALMHSLPSYPLYTATRSLFLRPINLLAMVCVVGFLFRIFMYTKKRGEPEVIQLTLLGLLLGVIGGAILIELW